jgi:glucose-6-phosphate-specific signal transduction histidine kinase
MLFRVAQEVLDDALGRGGARHVELLIEPEGEGYVMEIGDDGTALQSRLADAMPSVRHRVELAGGHIEAESRAGEGGQAGGNRIRVYVPRSTAGSA